MKFGFFLLLSCTVDNFLLICICCSEHDLSFSLWFFFSKNTIFGEHSFSRNFLLDRTKIQSTKNLEHKTLRRLKLIVGNVLRERKKNKSDFGVEYLQAARPKISQFLGHKKVD